jgi:hypothetical protein
MVKFGEMSAGQRFTDGRRNFIKLQTLLPSGYTQIHQRVVNRNPEGFELESPTALEFNSVDLDDGGPAKCPDWRPFQLLED